MDLENFQSLLLAMWLFKGIISSGFSLWVWLQIWVRGRGQVYVGPQITLLNAVKIVLESSSQAEIRVTYEYLR
jgi:hypothetical protein